MLNLKKYIIWLCGVNTEICSNIDPIAESNDTRYPTKYSASHYLTVNIGKRWSVGLFESVVWAAQDAAGERNFDWAYMNPIIFYRPAEYSIGSPDNITMGANMKYILGQSQCIIWSICIGRI